MDKQTLSNYGWIVVCILVLSVMLALATPFGEFVAGGFKATYIGFSHTADKALSIIGLGGNGGSGGEQGGQETPTDPITNLELIITTINEGGSGMTYLIANRPIESDEKIPVSWTDGMTLSDVTATGSNSGYVNPSAFTEMDMTGEGDIYYVAIINHNKDVLDYMGVLWDGSSTIRFVEYVSFEYNLNDGIRMGNGTINTKFMIVYDGLTPNDAMLSNSNVSYEDGVATFYLAPNSSIDVTPAEGIDGAYLNTYPIPVEGNPEVINHGSTVSAYFVENSEDCITWAFIVSTDPNAGGEPGGAGGSIANIDLGIINHNTLVITTPEVPVDTYEIYVNDELVATTSETTFDLSTYLTQPGEIGINVLGYHEGETVAANMIFFQYIPAPILVDDMGLGVYIENSYDGVTYMLYIDGELFGEFDIAGTFNLIGHGLVEGQTYECYAVAQTDLGPIKGNTITMVFNDPTCYHTGETWISDQGNGTHAYVCSDCNNVLSNTKEAHYDNNDDNYCDVCNFYADPNAPVVDSLDAPVLALNGNILEFADVENAVIYEVYYDGELLGEEEYQYLNGVDLVDNFGTGHSIYMVAVFRNISGVVVKSAPSNTLTF